MLPGRGFRWGVVWPRLLLLSLVLLSALHLAASFAQADPYAPPSGIASEPDLPAFGSCPAGGYGSYSGEDDAATELRALREELAAMCAALADRQDEVAHRLWWVVAEQLAAAEQRATGNALLVDVKTALNDVKTALDAPVQVAVSGPDPLPVHDAAGAEYSEAVQAATEVNTDVSNSGTWILVGVLLGSMVIAIAWRVLHD